jgi:vacuolar-type H+-ATPase subunit H
MAEELLSEIVAAEREIRARITRLEEELAARLAAVLAEAEAMLAQEEASLAAELDGELAKATRLAEKEARSRVAEALAYAERLDALTAEQLDDIVSSHLQAVCQGEHHDRPDEQG